MSEYRIDMAVVHPNDSSRYIPGVECDGTMYHSSPSARERDVYPKDIWNQEVGQSNESGAGIGGRIL